MDFASRDYYLAGPREIVKLRRRAADLAARYPGFQADYDKREAMKYGNLPRDGEPLSEFVRKAENAAGAFAFWFDLDVGEAKATMGAGYPTQRDALQALKDFCAAVALPRPPVIVSSGFGLHCYFVLTEFVPAERWREFAQKLKALAKRHGLRADPSRSADLASLLRVPATMNFKIAADPRPVQILHKGAPIDFVTFAAALETAFASQEADHATADGLGANTTRNPPPETEKNIALATSMLDAIDPDVPYPQWLKVVWALRSTNWTCGERLAREWSRRGEKWKNGGAEAFDKLMRDFKPDGGISFGTLVYIACEHGWSPMRPGADGETNAAYGDAATPGTLKAAAEEFNRHHFVARIAGGAFVFCEMDEALLDDAMTFEGFKNFHQHEEAEGKPIAAYWLKWPPRRTYSKLAFDPSGECQKERSIYGAASRLNPARANAT